MHCVRVPLATIGAPPQPQPQLQLSPLKGLSLADKENTVSWRGRGAGRRAPARPGHAPHRASPRSPPP